MPLQYPSPLPSSDSISLARCLTATARESQRQPVEEVNLCPVTMVRNNLSELRWWFLTPFQSLHDASSRVICHLLGFVCEYISVSGPRSVYISLYLDRDLLVVASDGFVRGRLCDCWPAWVTDLCCQLWPGISFCFVQRREHYL